MESPKLRPAVYAAVGRENPHGVRSLKELEEGVAKFCKSYAVGFKVADDETAARMNATPEESIQLRIAYVQVSLGRRLTDLLRGIIDHINGERLLELALCARACMELAGAIIYYENRLTSLFRNGISTQEEMARFNEIVVKATRGGRFDWTRWFVTRGDLEALIAEYAQKETSPTSPVQVKNVVDFVKALDRSVAAKDPPKGLMQTVYGLLSDVCHPAVGGYLLYLSVPQQPGHLSFDVHPNQQMASWFAASIVSPVANRLMKHAAMALQRLRHIAEAVGTEGG